MKTKSLSILAFCGIIVGLLQAHYYSLLSYSMIFIRAELDRNSLLYVFNTDITPIAVIFLSVFTVLGFFLDRQKFPFKCLSVLLVIITAAGSIGTIKFFAVPIINGKLADLLNSIVLFDLLLIIMRFTISIAVISSALLQLFYPKFKTVKLVIFITAAAVNLILAVILLILSGLAYLEKSFYILAQTFLILPAFYDGFSLRTEKITPCTLCTAPICAYSTKSPLE